MKRKTVLMSLAVMFAAVTVCYAAENVNMGTWKMNDAKSKIGQGMQKSSTVVYSADGDKVKITVDGTDADGKAIHSEWTGKFDGKDYPVSGEPGSDTRAYSQVNAHTLHMVVKKDGKIVSSGRIVVAADGKSRTVSITATEATGKKMSSTAVYDKE